MTKKFADMNLWRNFAHAFGQQPQKAHSSIG